MSLNARDKLTPQMADYDRVGYEWVPYIMRANCALRELPSVTTDQWGLRNTIDRDGKIIPVEALDRLPQGAKIGVVAGTSAVFGVGATHDRFTIPSRLNQMTGTTWINLGGRAYNSMQEMILFLLHLPRKVDTIVVLSGINNLTLAFLGVSPSYVYNSFFGQSIYERVMGNPAEADAGIRQAGRYLLQEVWARLRPKRQPPAKTEAGSSYAQVLHCFRRDLRAFQALASGLGARLHFALQPLATWMDKPLAPEEEQIFKILDTMSDWQVLAHQLAGMRQRYLQDIRLACTDHAVPFCDLNQAPEFNESTEWLFVDRLHLTDRGYEKAAEVLKQRFAL